MWCVYGGVRVCVYVCMYVCIICIVCVCVCVCVCVVWVGEDQVDSNSFPPQQMAALREENSSLKNMVQVRYWGGA